jgi:ubiquinone/menaquinone biosynthesis C-methylase UbiE
MLAPKAVAYDPSRYLDIETVDEAIEIITSGTETLTSKQRWDNETPALMQIIERHIHRDSWVLDYGCGIGRLAKPLVEKLNCKVIGVDFSANMRALAVSMVDSPRFFAIDPQMMDALTLKADAAIAVWTLQHCMDLKQAIWRITELVRPGGALFVVNNKTRCLPVENGEWADDGLNVDEMIQGNGFEKIEGGSLDDAIAPGWMKDNTFWAVYRRV